MNPSNEDVKQTPIVAVCGKGGVGKTAFSALFSHVLIEDGVKPLLMIDADPVGGLVSATGEKIKGTLAGVREKLISAARNADGEEKERLARDLDYLLLESLTEHSGHSILAMGHSPDKGCFCPANVLLRDAIAVLANSFALVMIDAEAGIEQISRRVTRQVTDIIMVTDGSKRSIDTIEKIVEMSGAERLFAVANRFSDKIEPKLPENVVFAGSVPEDETLRSFDCDGRSLWQLPDGNSAVSAIRNIAVEIGFTNL